MCSAPESPLGRLARAIEDLAADCRDAGAQDQLAERIARVWGMVADLDPELARRRPRYEGTARAGAAREERVHDGSGTEPCAPSGTGTAPGPAPAGGSG